MTNNYAAGVRVEHAVIHHLAAEGYETQRAASSKGMADVIAIKNGQVLLVSCKRTQMPPPAEREALVRLANLLPGVGVPLVALKPAREPLAFRRLTGYGPRDWTVWSADYAEEAS